VGTWKACATVYDNAVPGAPRPDPILGRCITARIGADGRVAFEVDEHPLSGFERAGRGATCRTEGELRCQGEQWIFVERATTCIKAVPRLPYEHAVRVRLHTARILQWTVQKGGISGVHEQVGLIRQKRAQD